MAQSDCCAAATDGKCEVLENLKYNRDDSRLFFRRQDCQFCPCPASKTVFWKQMQNHRMTTFVSVSTGSTEVKLERMRGNENVAEDVTDIPERTSFCRVVLAHLTVWWSELVTELISCTIIVYSIAKVTNSASHTGTRAIMCSGFCSC